MDAIGTRTLKLGITVGLSLGAIVGLVGCGNQLGGDESGSLPGVDTENGLAMNGLAMNGLAMNGLAMNGLAMNGLAMNGLAMNGLASIDGLSSTSGMMTTAGGRDIVKYMVKCAFPAGQSLTKQDQYGTSYTFDGSIGIAPEAINGPCDLQCQEKISACLLAHVNNSGAHIGIWLDGPDPGIGWGANPAYPYQEGAFFGNLITTPWQGYYCGGKDMSSGEVPGRLGTPLATSVYTNPYGTNVPCKNACTITNEGYTNCSDYQPQTPYTAGHKWTHVITVWRNFESSQMYKICTKQTPARCLGVVGGSTAEVANIEQRSYNSTPAMQWQIVQVESGKYKFVNVGSGKAIDVNGSQMVQRSYNGAAGQKIPVVYFADQAGWANLKPSSGTTGISADSANDGALMKLSSNLSPDWAKWGFTALGMAPSSSTGTAGTTGTASTGGSAGTGGTGGSPATTYHLIPQHATSKSIDIQNDGQTVGTPVIQFATDFNANSQAFYMNSSNGNVSFSMKLNSAKCIGGSNNGTGVGTLVVVQDCNGSNYQAFQPVSQGGNVYMYKYAANPSLCLDVQGGSGNDNVLLQLYTCFSGGANQKFSIQ